MTPCATHIPSSSFGDLDLAEKNCVNKMFHLNTFFFLSLLTDHTDIFPVFINDLNHLHEIYKENAISFII